MNNPKTLAAALLATAVAAVALTACGTDDGCGAAPVMYYSSVDHTYHYGSVTGKKVPASKVPGAARKVPGYKPYNPPKAPAARVPIGKPGPAYKAPSAPRPLPPYSRKR